jgi:hypothetical protein
MATKNNPGPFDCYAAAEPDEPIFVLLGRDRHAPALLWLWCVLREMDQEDPAKITEARECAVSMIEWAATHGKKSVGLGQAALAGVFELIRMANYRAEHAGNEMSDIDAVRKFFCTTTFEPATPENATAQNPPT